MGIPVSLIGSGRLLDNWYAECLPNQFLRELTVNSLEAIDRKIKSKSATTGNIVWDTTKIDGVNKLRIVDNGDGMDKQTLEACLSGIACGLSDNGNYGIGAKITSFTPNPFGIIYRSWQGGVGHMIYIHRVGSIFELRDSVAVDESVWPRPKIINDSGTEVVFLGKSKSDKTFKSLITDDSIIKYLNTRFVTLPSNVEIKIWNTSNRSYRVLRGQKVYLDQYSVARGTIQLTDSKIPAVAHWWILKTRDSKTNQSRRTSLGEGRWDSGGGLGLVYDKEIYERYDSLSLLKYGVGCGVQKRVKIYIEPAPTKVRALQSRAGLMVRGQEFALDQNIWSTEFSSKLPDEIVELILKSETKSSTDHYSKLSKYFDRFSLTKGLRRVGSNQAGDESSQVTKASKTSKTGKKKTSKKKASKTGKKKARGKKQKILRSGLNNSGTLIDKTVIPNCVWISESDGSRTVGQLDGRAAEYVPQTNTLYINADFASFNDEIRASIALYRAPRKRIEAEVRNEFELQLVEPVASVAQAIANNGGSEEFCNKMKSALTPEAFTAIALKRMNVCQNVGRKKWPRK